MSVTKVTYCRPQQNLANNINKLYTKTSLRQFEQLALNQVAKLIQDSSFVKSVSSLTDDECETFELAPVERDRFSSGVHMAFKEAATVIFEHLNGIQNTGSIVLTTNAHKLEKAFGLYCSGSFRRDSLIMKFGDELAILSTKKDGEERKAEYSVVIECQYDLKDDIPQIKTYHAHRNSDNWITRAIFKDVKNLVDEVNKKMEFNYVK